MSKNFKITEFKLSDMVMDPSIVMVAKRGSGKSWITRDIVHNYKTIPGGVVLSPTDKMNPFYKKFFPDLYIHHDINESIFKRILNRQALMIDKAKAKKKKGIIIDPSGILVMDDCLAAKAKWAKDPSITEILMNGRHYKLTYVLTMQTPLGVAPDLRLNFDYVFLLKDDSYVNKKKLYDNYASMFPSLAAFELVFRKCTEDYKSMVINNRFPSDNIQEKVFWFKAADRKFKFGSKTFIDIYKKYYKGGVHIIPGVEMNINELFGAKKKMIDVNVDLK